MLSLGKDTAERKGPWSLPSRSQPTPWLESDASEYHRHHALQREEVLLSFVHGVNELIDGIIINTIVQCGITLRTTGGMESLERLVPEAASCHSLSILPFFLVTEIPFDLRGPYAHIKYSISQPPWELEVADMI